MTKEQQYKQIITSYSQKLFHLSYCIVKDQELAEIIVEKSFITAYKTFETTEFSHWENYLLKLTTKSALLCKKSTTEEKKKLLEKKKGKRAV
ncbi:MAG: hypothetical protein ABF649_09675 [Bacillus sp. (in: firmicutes)]